jgi:hypothetical protein
LRHSKDSFPGRIDRVGFAKTALVLQRFHKQNNINGIFWQLTFSLRIFFANLPHTAPEEAKTMLKERADNTEHGYKCSRCGAMFGSYSDEDPVKCPYCSMLCDEAKCRVVETSNEDY